MDPVGVEGLDSIDHVPDRLVVGEDPDLAVVLAHHAAEVLGHHRWLITGLDEEIGRKYAPGGLVEQHHRVPVVNVRRLQEAELVLAEINHLPPRYGPRRGPNSSSR